jgi:FkbM family methyltransferase
VIHLFQRGFEILRGLALHPSPPLNRGRAFLRFVLRNLHKRILRKSIFFQWNGLNFEVFPDSVSAARVFYMDLPDWWEMNFIKQFLKPGDLCADVGANIGAYTLLAASLVGGEGKVAAFEPDPRNAGKLRYQVQRNALTQVELVEAAVGSEEGEVRFFGGHDVVNNVKYGEGGNLRVSATTLDRFYSERGKPIFIKVDVEGFEQAVVKGAKGLMSTGFPLVWQLEVGVRPDAYGFSDAELAALLRSNGYEFYRYNVRAKLLIRCGEEHWSQEENVLAIRNHEQVMARLQAGGSNP